MPLDPKTKLRILGPINERSSQTYVCELDDGGGGAVTTLDSLEVCIYHADTGQYLREKSNILSSFSDSRVSFEITADDNRILDPESLEELHILRFDYTWGGGKEGHHAVILSIRNLGRLG
jgi:hypothetical protein